MMKYKEHLLEFLAILIAFILIGLLAYYLEGCTKQEMYESPPEPYLIHDKQVKFEGQKKVGERIKFWVSMPEPYTQNLQWYFDYGHSDNFISGTDTIYYTYNKAGLYYVKVVGWSGEAFNSELGLSDAAKLQIKD